MEKIQEELEEKIETFNTFIKTRFELKEKILKSASKDILGIIVNISKKILEKEVDSQAIEKIIKKTIGLLEKKENATIILSEKYAKILFKVQNKSLDNEIETDFQKFRQYDGFDIIYNPKFDDDTIIVENIKERLDASVLSQLDIIVRDIYNNSKDGEINLDEYIKENETE